MRKAWIAFSVLLAACQGAGGPMLSSYKPGSTYESRQADYDACKIASFREIPQTMTTEVSGGYYDPGRVQCSTIAGITNCRRSGGIDIPARANTYDQNEGLRDRYIKRCMQAKGYALLERPVCTSEADRRRALYQPQPASPAEFACSAGVNMEG